MANKYSLQVVISSRSGAYLADTRVTINWPNNQKILDVPLDAPWLLVDLVRVPTRFLVAQGAEHKSAM
jgi:hypothetical protein